MRRAVAHAGRPAFSDVVGDLLGIDDGVAVIDTRHGQVEVVLDDVAFAKPAPPSTADELALQAVAAAGWQPAEAEWLGGWLLRADHGFSRRANSVLPLRQPGLPLADALAAARDWYAARGLPLLLQLPTEARRLLDAELGEQFWPTEAEAVVYAARLDRIAAPATVPVVLSDVASDEWSAVYFAGVNDDPGLRAACRELLARHERVAFASVHLDGRTVAVARGVVDEGWLGLSAVAVDPGYRRQGLAGSLLAGLRDWARALGASRSYLQVEADNAPAIALYEKLGYWAHHEYRYRRDPGPGETP